MKMWKAFFLSMLAVAPFATQAQMEKFDNADVADATAKIQSLRQTVKNPLLKNLLQCKDFSGKQKVNIARVAKDIGDFSEAVVHYAVPAMSDIQRLPDAYPLDGTALAPVRIIMAQDEYEPGSFVVYPLADQGKVEFKLTPFVNEKGVVFPAKDLDMKVIKVWYQNGNGWYSYFADTELKLCPELLLNDEDLIKVDTKTVQNWARLTEKDGKVSYFWLTPPREVDHRFGYPPWSDFASFQCMRPNFVDAAELKPITLNAGEFKQFFLTAHTAANQAPGLYKGAVNMVKGGKTIGSIPVTVKVLPFVLPKPCAYADTDKPFLVSSYSYISFELISKQNGGDMELTKRQLEATLANQVAHNQDMHMIRGQAYEYEFEFTVDTMKKVGMRKDYVMGSYPTAGSEREMKHFAKLQANYIHSLGYKKAFMGYGDEPGAGWVMQNRPIFEAYQSQGMNYFIAGGDQVFYAGGFLYDFFNTARDPEDREATRKWNEVGHAWVAWYATHHVGPENPSYTRRQYGLAPYFANYSALCNYAHHYGSYNDRSDTYKPMVFAYGTGNGVIDTLGWEGFREGIDDIRYATALKRLAKEASANPDIKIQYAGRSALQYMAEYDLTGSDLNATRLEMIRRILNLRQLLNKK